MEKVTRKVSDCAAFARQVFPILNDWPIPTVEYSNMISYAAIANVKLNRIKISILYLREQENETLNDTIPHEIAHIVADKLYGKNIKPHGKEWYNIAVMLGSSGKVTCERLQIITPRSRRNFQLFCGCKVGPLVSRILVERIKSGDEYLCPTCRETVTINER